MIKTLLRSSVVVAPLLVASPALAAPTTTGGDIEGPGTFIFSAERLFTPLAIEKATTTNDVPGVGEVKSSSSRTSIGLFGSTLGGTLTPYNTPRLGFDYTIIKGLTLGLSASFVHYSTSSETSSPGRTTTTDGASVTGFLMSPRVGYAMKFSQMLGFWVKGGFTFYTAGTGDQDPSDTHDVTYSYSGLALDIEPQLLVMPITNFGFTFGFAADIPLSGSQTVTDKTRTVGGVETKTETKQDLTFSNFGLTAGLIGFF